MQTTKITSVQPPSAPKPVDHPAWERFIQFCIDLRHGEIERLSIQDGVPVLAETATRKVKFNK
jgi:hypothetical protein